VRVVDGHGSTARPWLSLIQRSSAAAGHKKARTEGVYDLGHAMHDAEQDAAHPKRHGYGLIARSNATVHEMASILCRGERSI
jgi:hypothetical protein